MITGNYTLVASPEWRNVQLEDVFLECDTTDADVNLTLPNITDLNRSWGVRLHIINKAGANKVNVIAFTQVEPEVTNTINGGARVSLTAGVSTLISVEDETSWLSSISLSSVLVPIVKATLAKADLASAANIALPVGSQLAVTNYAATGSGCTIVKTSLVAGTFADWIITATEDATDTGHIGENVA